MDYNVAPSGQIHTRINVPTHGYVDIWLASPQVIAVEATLTLESNGMIYSLNKGILAVSPETRAHDRWQFQHGLQISGSSGNILRNKTADELIQCVRQAIDTWVQVHPEVLDHMRKLAWLKDMDQRAKTRYQKQGRVNSAKQELSTADNAISQLMVDAPAGYTMYCTPVCLLNGEHTSHDKTNFREDSVYRGF